MKTVYISIVHGIGLFEPDNEEDKRTFEISLGVKFSIGCRDYILWLYRLSLIVLQRPLCWVSITNPAVWLTFMKQTRALSPKTGDLKCKP